MPDGMPAYVIILLSKRVNLYTAYCHSEAFALGLVIPRPIRYLLEGFLQKLSGATILGKPIWKPTNKHIYPALNLLSNITYLLGLIIIEIPSPTTPTM